MFIIDIKLFSKIILISAWSKHASLRPSNGLLFCIIHKGRKRMSNIIQIGTHSGDNSMIKTTSNLSATSPDYSSKGIFLNLAHASSKAS